jgi:Fe2+ transport system protein FeoA
MGESQPELLKFMEDHGLIPGKTVQISEVLPFNQTLTVLVDDRRVSVGFAAAGFIYVERMT